MTSDIEVWVEGIQRYIGAGADEHTEPVIVRADGRYRFVANKLHIVYDEKTDDPKVVIRNHLVIDGNRVEVRRSGPVSAVMVFENGLAHEFSYSTPYGVIPMSIRTKSIQAKEESDTVLVDIKYDLFAGGEHAADCETHMRFRSKIF